MDSDRMSLGEDEVMMSCDAEEETYVAKHCMSIQTLICKLWNFKTLTIDIPVYCADGQESTEFLTYIKE